MIQKDEVQLQKTRGFKALRTAIRLKHSLAADDEINRVLPEYEQAFDAAVSASQPFELDVASVFEDES